MDINKPSGILIFDNIIFIFFLTFWELKKQLGSQCATLNNLEQKGLIMFQFNNTDFLQKKPLMN